MSELRTKVENWIDAYVKEIGLTKEQTYNEERRAWYWVRGSANIEVFVQEIPMGDYSREFLRVFSPLMKVPKGKENEFYLTLLNLNDSKLGIKISIMEGTDQVYATYERDIVGIDYDEVKTCIADLEWWADELDDILINQFGGTK
jgi:hypothetical protein